MDIDSAASTPIVKGTGQPSDAALPAVRADRARLSPGRAAVGLLGAGHWPWRRSRSAVGARLRRHSRRWRRDQPHHRPRRHAGPVPRLLGRHLPGSASDHSRGRRPELRAPEPDALRRDSGVARRHVGRHRRRRLHADRELAVHRRSLRRVPRPSQRPRHPDDHALGVRRPPPRVARPGRVRRARTRRLEAPGDRPLRSRRHVSAEEDAVHRGRRRAGCGSSPTISSSRSCTRQASSPIRSRRSPRRWFEPERAPPTTVA